MGQAAAVLSEPVIEQPVAPPPAAAFVVIVASDPARRAEMLARFDPETAVLAVPSIEMAAQLMGARPVRRETAEPAGGQPPRPSSAVTIHEDRHAVGFDHVEVSLTPLEFALLRQLITDTGRVWRYDELVREVWDTDHLGDASQVHAVVKRLRAKLARERAPIVIEAVRGVGFRAVRPTKRTA